MNKTILIQIGNSDDKLSQQEWSEFVREIKSQIDLFAENIHFFSGSPNYMPWQNVAWIIDCSDYVISNLKSTLSTIGRQFQQDAIAWSVCKTEFI